MKKISYLIIAATIFIVALTPLSGVPDGNDWDSVQNDPQDPLLYGQAVSWDDWLHAEGNKIYDRDGREVWLTGINWFGFDTVTCVFHGLWSRDLEDMLDQTADLGFNVMRIPVHAELVNLWRQRVRVYPAPGTVTILNWDSPRMNEYLAGLSSLEILDYAIDYCEEVGLKVILDMHSIAPDEYDYELWYKPNFSFGRFRDCWEYLVSRYSNSDVVIGVDLKNEPHGTISQGSQAAKWDNSNDPNNWKRAAEIIAEDILAINPNLLILVEGIQEYRDSSIEHINIQLGIPLENNQDPALHNGWWGGNLMGARYDPVNLGPHQSQLVYAPHEYGPNVHVHPWFYNGYNARSMRKVWDQFWFFIYENNTTPILFGEWGGKVDPVREPLNYVWMEALRDFIVENRMHHTFWCLNENSRDTGGILVGSSWNQVDMAKYIFIEPTLWQDRFGRFIGLDHQVDLGRNGTNVSAVSPPPPPHTPTPPPTPPGTPTPPLYIMGDVDINHRVDMVDALVVAQFYIGVRPFILNPLAADVDYDNRVTILDALIIAQYVVGIVDEL